MTTAPNPYFGIDEKYSQTPHTPDHRNQALQLVDVRGRTLRFSIAVNNSGNRTAHVSIGLFVRWFSLDEWPDKSQDDLALITMSGMPTIQWESQHVPKDDSPGWSSGECQCTIPLLACDVEREDKPHEHVLMVVATLRCPEIALGPTSQNPTTDQCVAVHSLERAYVHSRKDAH